jgi:putative ABC transport system permease protein
MILLHDLRHGLRSLLRQPLFTVVAVLVLGLGIGANTAVFSVIDAVLLRPLPYPRPDRLVLVREVLPLFDSGSVSYPNYLDWCAGQNTLTDLALARRSSFNLSDPRAATLPERVDGAEMTWNLCRILGVHPLLGRDFTADDDHPGSGKVALLSEGLWRRRFGSNPGVLGQRVVLNAVSYEIVGVLPESWGFPRRAQVAVPLGDLRKDANLLSRGNHNNFSSVGRLRDGVTIAAAKANLNAIAQELERRYPDTNTGRRVNVKGLLEYSVGDYRGGLYLLLGAVGCVLLIACANVANLQLARATARTKELAIRAALGAGRGRLVRQLLTESALLGVLGGAVGLLLAMWALDAIIALSPPDSPRFHDIHLDWQALGFAGAIALGAGLLVGIWPAWRISRVATMAAALHEGNARGSTGGAGRVRARSLLVVAQVAMTLVLLAGAGAAIQSFWRIRSAPLGFRSAGLLRVAISLPRETYQKEKVSLFYRTLLARVRALPGVASAACGANTPFDDSEWDSFVHVTGTPPDKLGEEPLAEMNSASPDYFRTMGIPLLRGHDFDGSETLGQPREAIVDESFVRKFFPHEDPLGKHIDDNQTLEKNPPPMMIIGVVGRTLNEVPGNGGFADKMTQIHLCAYQDEVNDAYLLVRATSGDPLRLVEPIRRAVLSLDGDLPIADVTTVSASMDASMASQRLTAVLLGIFAALALTLASLGLYGVMALGVTQRTRELGIRLALGAQRSAVLGLVLRQGVGLVGIGLGIGLVAALALGHLLTSAFYGVSGGNVETLLWVCLVLAATALTACWVPAHRATRVDPMVALRDE